MTQESGVKEEHKTMWGEKKNQSWGVWKAAKSMPFPDNVEWLACTYVRHMSGS